MGFSPRSNVVLPVIPFEIVFAMAVPKKTDAKKTVVKKTAAKKTVAKSAPKKTAAKSAPKKTAAKKAAKKVTTMNKSEVLESIASSAGLEKKAVKNVLGTLVELGHSELKSRGTFVLHGFAKFVVKNKPATKARKGINPFTKEPCMFKVGNDRDRRREVRADAKG